MLEHPLLDAGVQLRQRVVEEEHRHRPDGVLDRADLGEAQGQGEESLLPARAKAPEIVPAHRDGDVVPVRSHERLTPPGFIPGPRPDRLVKGFRGRLDAQGGSILEVDRPPTPDLLVDPRHLAPQQLDTVLALLDDLETDLDELFRPRIEPRREARTIALLEEMVPAGEHLPIPAEGVAVGRVDLGEESIEEVAP